MLIYYAYYKPFIVTSKSFSNLRKITIILNIYFFMNEKSMIFTRSIFVIFILKCNKKWHTAMQCDIFRVKKVKNRQLTNINDNNNLT